MRRSRQDKGKREVGCTGIVLEGDVSCDEEIVTLYGRPEDNVAGMAISILYRLRFLFLSAKAALSGAAAATRGRVSLVAETSRAFLTGTPM